MTDRAARPPSAWKRAVAWALSFAAASLAPRVTAWTLAAQATPTFEGAQAAELALARGAHGWGTVDRADFSTGAELFDREWAFGTPMMRAACLAQVTLRHGSGARELREPLADAARDLTSPEARAFSRKMWGSDPLAEDEPGHDHTAMLGYGGFALGLAQAAGWRDDAGVTATITARLSRRLTERPRAWPETYPGEVYPVDVAAGVGALALAARLRGEPPASDPAVGAGLELIRSAIDAPTGMLQQALAPETGGALDGPRGSGTFLAAYFLLPADAALARDLFIAGRRELRGDRLGFVAMRERPRSAPGGGDVDSGPVIFGFGVSATGFALSGARAFGDGALFGDLSATAALFGAPVTDATGARRHVGGGPLGDAILCAMSTAPSPEELDRWLQEPS